jgi:hypothetical protein
MQQIPRHRRRISKIKIVVLLAPKDRLRSKRFNRRIQCSGRHYRLRQRHSRVSPGFSSFMASFALRLEVHDQRFKGMASHEIKARNCWFSVGCWKQPGVFLLCPTKLQPCTYYCLFGLLAVSGTLEPRKSNRIQVLAIELEMEVDLYYRERAALTNCSRLSTRLCLLIKSPFFRHGNGQL